MTTSQNKFYSTKFTVTMLFALATVSALFLRLIDGGTFVAAATLILGVFSTADVVTTFVTRQPPPER